MRARPWCRWQLRGLASKWRRVQYAAHRVLPQRHPGRRCPHPAIGGVPSIQSSRHSCRCVVCCCLVNTCKGTLNLEVSGGPCLPCAMKCIQGFHQRLNQCARHVVVVGHADYSPADLGSGPGSRAYSPSHPSGANTPGAQTMKTSRFRLPAGIVFLTLRWRHTQSSVRSIVSLHAGFQPAVYGTSTPAGPSGPSGEPTRFGTVGQHS